MILPNNRLTLAAAERTVEALDGKIRDLDVKLRDLEQARRKAEAEAHVLALAGDKDGLKRNSNRVADIDSDIRIATAQRDALAESRAAAHRDEAVARAKARLAPLESRARKARTAVIEAAERAFAALPLFRDAIAAEREDAPAQIDYSVAHAAANAELAALGLEPIPAIELPPAPRGWFGPEPWNNRALVSSFLLPSPVPGKPIHSPAGYVVSKAPARGEAAAYARDTATAR